MDKFKKIGQKQVFNYIESGRIIEPALLPEKVRELRKALRITQSQMAKKLGITQSVYMRMEKQLNSSSLKTIVRFLKELNCDVGIQIKPKIPFSKQIRQRALQKAKALLDRTYGSMALEKQSPDKGTYEKRLKELADELADNPAPSLWED